MRKNNILIPLASLALLASCSKNLQPTETSFGVESFNNAKQPATTFKVGDTVNFVFKGNPDQITFFSGEIGKRYEYTTRLTDPTSIDSLSFWNTQTNPGNGTMQLLVSTTFPTYTQINSVDSAAVKASFPAGWTDISDRGTWSDGTGAKKSNIALNDFAAAGKPIWLAFRYTAAAGAAQASWNINSLGLRHYISDTNYTIANGALVTPSTFPAFTASPGFGVVSAANPLVKFTLNNPYSGPNNNRLGYSQASGTTTGVVTITGANAATAAETDTWLISGPIDLHKVLPDGGGVFVKNITTNAENTLYGTGGINSSWASFAYKFTRPGTYNATFVSATNTRDEQNRVPKIITITVQ